MNDLLETLVKSFEDFASLCFIPFKLLLLLIKVGASEIALLKNCDGLFIDLSPLLQIQHCIGLGTVKAVISYVANTMLSNNLCSFAETNAYADNRISVFETTVCVDSFMCVSSCSVCMTWIILGHYDG